MIRVWWRYCDLICRCFLWILVLACCGEYGGFLLLLFFIITILVYFWLAWNVFFNFEAIKLHTFDKKFWAVFVDYFVCYLVVVLWAADNRFHDQKIFCLNISLPSFHILCRMIENIIMYAVIVSFVLFGDNNNNNNGISVFQNDYTYWYFWITTVTLGLEPLLYLLIKNDAQQNAVSTKEVNKNAASVDTKDTNDKNDEKLSNVTQNTSTQADIAELVVISAPVDATDLHRIASTSASPREQPSTPEPETVFKE